MGAFIWKMKTYAKLRPFQWVKSLHLVPGVECFHFSSESAPTEGWKNQVFKFILQDGDLLRSPHLVPYSKVDEAIKKANRFVLKTSRIEMLYWKLRSLVKLAFIFIEIQQVKLFVLYWFMDTILIHRRLRHMMVMFSSFNLLKFFFSSFRNPCTYIQILRKFF